MNAHDEGRRRREDFENRCRQNGHVSVGVAERIHQRGQRTTALGESRVARRMEENLVLGHGGAIQQQHVLLAELLKQQTHATAGD